MEEFDKICKRRTKEDAREHCSSLKIGTDLYITDARQSLIAKCKVSRIKRSSASYIPLAIGQALKVGAENVLSAKVSPVVLTTGTVDYMG